MISNPDAIIGTKRLLPLGVIFILWDATKKPHFFVLLLLFSAL